MSRSLKQLLCLHWWEPVKTTQETSSYGQIVCGQQRTWTRTKETRQCKRCKLDDSRYVGAPIFEGWE